MKTAAPVPIIIDPHFAPAFYAALWALSESTVTKWFRDAPGVLKVGAESKNGRRTRVELRIPYSLAMQIYTEKTQ